MKYKKAQDILPQDLIVKLQEFMDGGYLYIPRKEENKKSWGDNTEIKKDLLKRNKKIYNDFNNGMTVKQLSTKYYLVENSIRRILREYKDF
ncbi:CD3324 family protein [Clostridium sp. D53t1_180928_C8]|uniref:CD3324 family protein n=1 Tax=Clostridium sp. D53t1_180928_C8 TaxID=2787101 RepID=UPI0018AA421C|nr:CD3324 family protein [Clostridium sp. D53t1_180928_C8]